SPPVPAGSKTSDDRAGRRAVVSGTTVALPVAWLNGSFDTTRAGRIRACSWPTAGSNDARTIDQRRITSRRSASTPRRPTARTPARSALVRQRTQGRTRRVDIPRRAVYRVPHARAASCRGAPGLRSGRSGSARRRRGRARPGIAPRPRAAEKSCLRSPSPSLPTYVHLVCRLLLEKKKKQKNREVKTEQIKKTKT